MNLKCPHCKVALEPTHYTALMTPVQRKVAPLWVRGMDSAQIAAALKITKHHVTTAMGRLYDITGANSKLKLAMLVYGLIDAKSMGLDHSLRAVSNKGVK